jgi:excisionase family DNA binding protein
MATKRFSPLMTIEEVAKVCLCGEETVRRWIRAGRLPAVKLPGGFYRIRRDDLVNLVQSKTTSGFQLPPFPGDAQ